MKKKLILLLAPLILLSCGGSKPEPTYTITFNCTDCKAYDESDKEVTSVTVPAVDPTLSLYREFHFEGNKPFKVPLKSNISIKKTGTDEIVEYKYVNGTISVPIVGNLTVTAIGSSYSKDLETSSWDEIAEIAETGRADEFFKVGDTKAVRLKGQDFDHTVRIIDFNHDYSELPDEGEPDPNKVLGITFEFANAITISYNVPAETYWNNKQDASSTNYDYRESTLNDFLNDGTEEIESVINMLPSSGDPSNPDLREVIKPVDKKVGVYNDSNGTYTATSFDGEDYPYPYLFSLAHDEMATHEDDVTNNEGSKYQYYIEHPNKENRIKTQVNGTIGEFYWLRSPYTYYNNYAWHVDFKGGFYHDIVYYNYLAVAPAFCI